MIHAKYQDYYLCQNFKKLEYLLGLEIINNIYYINNNHYYMVNMPHYIMQDGFII